MKKIKLFFKKLFGILSFDELPKNEQAVLVAKDILLQIDSERYIARTGSYITALSMGETCRYDADVKQNFENIKSCKVCAIGSVLLSTTKFKNRLTFDDLDHSTIIEAGSKSQQLLLSVFSPYQLALIEATFEGRYNRTDQTRLARKLPLSERVDTISREHEQKCAEFYNKYTSGYRQTQNKLLKAIMQNIIDNNGTFIP